VAKKKITIMELAARLGLSKSSVSKALHGSKEVSPATRKRVKEMADELGYQASAIARAIRSGRASSVGLVLRTDGEHSHKPFLSAFIDGISQRLGKDAYTLTLATANNEADMLKIHADLIATKAVDAFVVPRTMCHDSRADLLKEQGVPFVLYGRTTDCDDYAWYDINQEGYFESLVNKLVELGHSNIAYLGGDDTYFYESLRRDGFMRGIQAAGITDYVCVDHVVDITEGKHEALQLLKGGNPPTAFVCALDRVGIGVIQAAAQLQILAGKHISVAGYDGIPEGEFCQPSLSTCEVDNFKSGFQIADMVLRQIGGEKVSSLQVLGEAKTQWRGSTGPALFQSAALADLINQLN